MYRAKEAQGYGWLYTFNLNRRLGSAPRFARRASFQSPRSTSRNAPIPTPSRPPDEPLRAFEQ